MTGGRPVRAIRVLALLAAALAWAAPVLAAPAPQRVVSINVCTDQLAMLIAGEGQLHSVSVLASDPNSSTMTGEAKAFAVNHALAEEIFLMKPDLVLAGTFSSRATVGLLRSLGVQVEEFAPSRSFDDIRTNILRVGALLGQDERARELAAALDAGLADLAAAPRSGRSIALYDANSYTAGKGTLAGEIFRAAGLVNVGEALGVTGSGRVPLEMLIVARPDIIASSSRDYGAPALAQENFVHPAFAALEALSQPVSAPTPNMICGAPFTLEAAFLLQRAAVQGKAGQGGARP
ncbi:ABC transporter substrate-binding protein [Aquamicrobium segne]|uniref:ABC transporter substrate-binding protein n=1 Tax=Aquamicrobium segne TaxID=469547 RepID=A0ABW0GSV0_9HYPH